MFFSRAIIIDSNDSDLANASPSVLRRSIVFFKLSIIPTRVKRRGIWSEILNEMKTITFNDVYY